MPDANATLYSNSDISPRTEVHAERTMLKHAAPVVVLDRFGQSRPMPKNKGQVIKFRRPKIFSAKDTPLVEGVTPSVTKFGYEDVTGTMKQYGELVEVTDVIEDTHEDPVLNDASTQCGENVGRTQEALAWGVLRAGTNVYYTNGSARNAVNTPIAVADIRNVLRGLDTQKGMPITSVMDGSTKYSSFPVEAGMVAVCHTDLKHDIRELPGFVKCAEYGSQKRIHPREFGSVEETRFITSPDLSAIADAGGAKSGSGTEMVSTTGASADIYPIVVFAKEAYGYVPLRGQGAIDPTIIPVSKKDKSDPLGQRGYVGWKMWFLCIILNQAWMARIESAATAL